MSEIKYASAQEEFSAISKARQERQAPLLPEEAVRISAIITFKAFLPILILFSSPLVIELKVKTFFENEMSPPMTSEKIAIAKIISIKEKPLFLFV